MSHVLCEHCDNSTNKYKTIGIESVNFIGCHDCMDALIEMYERGTYSIEDYIRDLKK